MLSAVINRNVNGGGFIFHNKHGLGESFESFFDEFDFWLIAPYPWDGVLALDEREDIFIDVLLLTPDIVNDGMKGSLAIKNIVTLDRIKKISPIIGLDADTTGSTRERKRMSRDITTLWMKIMVKKYLWWETDFSSYHKMPLLQCRSIEFDLISISWSP